MNWRRNKANDMFCKGSIQDLGNGVVSDASIEPESIGALNCLYPRVWRIYKLLIH